MKKEIRLGKKEQRRERTAREKQTYEAQKVASRRRSATFRNPSESLTKYGVPDPAELQQLIDALLTEYRCGGIEEHDYPDWIFDPGLQALTELPIGLLDHREVALPPEMLPQDKDELQTLCERMIIRSQNQDIVELVLRGWSGSGTSKQKLADHVDELWRLREADLDIYRAIVCGQHGEVLLRMRKKTLPAGFGDGSLIRMLVRHGLLWCTNDIQLILARNALAERNPFGVLLSSDYRKLEPTRIVNDLRLQYLLLRLFLDLYVTSAAAKTGQAEPTEIPNDPIARLLRIRINRHAESNSIDLMMVRSKLDETIPHLRKILTKGGRRLRQELEKPVSANDLEKHFHGIWFSGLSNVQASAVPLLRYLQAETELEGMVRDLIPRKGQRPAARDGVALPAFAEVRLEGDWRRRIKDLLFLYRRELLKDADTSPAKMERSENAGWTAIQVACSFLQERGERLIQDHAGDENCPRRTYYLLDIIPEARLHRQLDMARYASVLAEPA